MSRIRGSGVMADLIRSKDWSSHELGTPETWPEQLVFVINTALDSEFPTHFYWGPSHCSFYNDGFLRIIGNKHPSLLGSRGDDGFADVWDRLGVTVNLAFGGKTSYYSNVRLDSTRNGYLEECYFTFSHSPMRAADGQILGVHAPCYDTTAQVLAERRLTALRSLADKAMSAKSVQEAIEIGGNLIAQTNDVPFAAVFMLDKPGTLKLRFASAVCASHPSITCIKDAAIEFDGGVTEQYGPFAAKALEAMLTRKTAVVDNVGAYCGHPFPFELNIYGEAVPVEISTVAFLPLFTSDQDNPSGVIAMAVCPRLALDGLYHIHFDLISRQVANSINTAKAYQNESQRAETLLQLDKAKTVFFSNVSHEFRMPLTLINGPLNEMLNDTINPLPAVHRSRLEMIQRNSSRLLKLVNSLLDYNRVEAGKVTASYAPVDLPRVTVDLASVFRSIIENAGLAYNVDIDPIEEPVYIDKDMWEKIIYNLLSNAFKFTLQGSVTVKLFRSSMPLTGESASSSGSSTPLSVPCAVLSVIDTGCGVPEAELPRLFERFHRIEGSKGRSYEGSGIGLTLTHDLVKLHGGRIVVKSKVGQGSSFSVVLPFGKAHLPVERVHSAAVTPMTSAEPSMDDVSSLYSSCTSNIIGKAFVEEATRWVPERAPSAVPSVTGGSSDDSGLISEYDMDLTVATLGALESKNGDVKNDAVDPDIITTLQGDVIIDWTDGNNPVLKRASFVSMNHDGTFEYPDSGTSSRAEIAWAQQQRHGKPLVLVVDDNKDMREYLQSLLLPKYRVITAVDGQDALDKLDWLIETLDNEDAVGLPNSIIADVMMPRVDGFQFIRRVHENQAIKFIPILLLSARAGEEARVDGLEYGADDYLAKPFSRKELMARLHTQVQIGVLRLQLEKMVSKRTKALVESETQYRLLSELTPIGIYRRDNMGRMTFASARFLEIVGITGLDIDALINWVRYTHPDDYADILRSIQMSAAGTPVSMEGRVIRPCDGKVTWLYKQTINDVTLASGHSSGTISVMSDITQLKVLQADRLVALENAEQESRKRAEDAEEHRRQQELFVDMVCHEIRNPLNGIVNNVDFLRSNVAERERLVASLPPTTTRDALAAQTVDDNSLLKSVDICVTHQRRITNDVLNLSKLSSGNMYLCLEPVRPTQLIASVCDMFSAQARSNNIDFTVHLPEAPLGHLCVHADPYRLSQVIVNLVSNALKFTLNCVERKVSVRLWILKPEVAEGASDRVVVNMSVKDTGVGMNEDEQASLFQRFRQANLKTYSRYGGTGLGLYISKMVLDLMGGEIHVQSAPQQGSTFSLAFPCTIADSALESRDAEVVAATSVHYLRSLAHSPKLLTLQPTVQPEDINSPITPISSARPSPEPASASELVSPISASSSSSAAAAAVRSRKRPLNILVVEDNDINQRILKRQLESSNAFKCQATVAENGLVAVNLVESQKFDLVLMDVEMPVMDGLEATKRIRLCEEQTQRHRIPIIGLSGNARDLHVAKGIEAGMDGYISKPYVKEDLFKTVLQATVSVE